MDQFVKCIPSCTDLLRDAILTMELILIQVAILVCDAEKLFSAYFYCTIRKSAFVQWKIKKVIAIS